MADTLQTWIERSYSVNCTDEQRRAIAQMCLIAQQVGDKPNSVWHQSAKYFGHKCNCVACNACTS